MSALRDLLASLDADQAAVAAWVPADGNLRVTAAAGSGKSRSVVALAARLVVEGVVRPERIVVTTFTNKAARELRTRLAAVVTAPELEQMRVGTFHSLALRALSQTTAKAQWKMTHCLDSTRGRATGIPSAAYIWMKVLDRRGDVPGLGQPGLGLDGDWHDYAGAVDLIRSKGIRYEMTALAQDAIQEGPGAKVRNLWLAWGMVEEAKRALGAWDFADALQFYYEALQAGELSGNADVVIVDEAQDNSIIQLALAKHLSKAGNLILVGDGRQCIFKFRGAFPDLFQKADTIIKAKTAEVRNNYRSGQKIVKLGNAVAQGKPWAVGAPASPARPEQGIVRIRGSVTPYDEANEIADEIAEAIKAGAAPGDFALLNRLNSQAGAMEAALTERKIPSVVVGGVPFFNRSEVQDAMAYCALAKADDMEAFARIANRPSRFLGKAFYQLLAEKIEETGLPLVPAIEAVAPALRGRSIAGAFLLASLISTSRSAKWPAPMVAAVTILAPPRALENVGVAVDGGGDRALERSGTLSVLRGLAEQFESWEAFKRFADRCAGAVTSVTEDEDLPEGRVTISTIHRAKGLEWKTVYLSCSHKLFPFPRSPLEEEERLFYVGVTRARDELVLTYTAKDIFDSEAGPSDFMEYAEPFVLETRHPESLVEHPDAAQVTEIVLDKLYPPRQPLIEED